MTLAPTSSSSSSTTTSLTPQKFWIAFSFVVGAVVLLSWRCRRGTSCGCQSIDGLESMGYERLTAQDPAIIQHDAQSFNSVLMTPVSPKDAVPRHAKDLDVVSPSSLQLLLRENAAPAFIGEDSSLFPNPTGTNIQAHSHDSELKPRGDHVEQGPC